MKRCEAYSEIKECKAYSEWVDACQRLRKLVSEDNAGKIIHMVRPEANVYSIEMAAARLERINRMLCSGFRPEDLMLYVNDQKEQYIYWALFSTLL